MNESCHIHEWVMSRTWMSHVTYMNESCHVHEWVMSHTWMSHVTYMNESRHIYELVTWHIRMIYSQVARQWGVSLINEARQARKNVPGKKQENCSAHEREWDWKRHESWGISMRHLQAACRRRAWLRCPAANEWESGNKKECPMSYVNRSCPMSMSHVTYNLHPDAHSVWLSCDYRDYRARERVHQKTT